MNELFARPGETTGIACKEDEFERGLDIQSSLHTIPVVPKGAL